MEDMHGRRVEPSALQRADAMLDAGRPDLAEPIVLSGLAESPDDSWLYFLLGRIHYLRDHYTEAERAFRQSLGLRADVPEAYVMLGAVLADQGRHQEAEESILTALSLHPDSSYGHHFYGVLMLKTGHVEKAEALVRRALELDPDNDAAHGLLATILNARGKRAEAQVHSERSIELDPDDDGAHATMGVTAFGRGRPFKARAHFRDALRIDPSNDDMREAYLQADMCCRVPYLPMYYFTLLIDRLPGKQFAVWGGFLVVIYGLPKLGVSKDITNVLALVYLAFVIYTWVIDLFMKLWLKMVPPK